MLDSLKELKTVSDRLNESSDSLNSLLDQINFNLNKLNLGLTIWVDLPPMTSKSIEIPPHALDAYGAEAVELLGYTKTQTGWGLAVKEATRVHGYFEGDRNCPFSNQIDEGEIRPLSSCSRDLRLRSIELLPELFRALKTRAEEFVGALEEAKKMAEDLERPPEKVQRYKLKAKE